MLIVLVFYPFLPESMRYFLVKGQEDEAYRILKMVAHDNKKDVPCFRLLHVGSPRVAFTDLLIPTLRKSTVLLWGLWFVNSFVYNGMMLMTTELFQQEVDGVRCRSGALFDSFWEAYYVNKHKSGSNDSVEPCRQLQSSDYMAVFFTSMAEVPGILATVFIIDRFGRRKTLFWELVLTGILCIVLTMCMGRAAETAVMFLIRALISGCYQALYVYTPEVYPTFIRSTAMGVAISVSRIGGTATPYVAQVVTIYSHYLSLGLYALVSIVAGVSALLLPMETTGMYLPDTLDDQVLSYKIQHLGKKYDNLNENESEADELMPQ